MATLFFPVRLCRYSIPYIMPRNCTFNSVFLQIISLQWQPLSRSCSPVPSRDQNNALRVNCSTLKHIVLYWPCQNSAFILALSAQAQSPALCCINNALHLTNVTFIDLRERKNIAQGTICDNMMCRLYHVYDYLCVGWQEAQIEKGSLLAFCIALSSFQLWLQGHHRREGGRKPCSQSDSINIYEGGEEPADCTLMLCQTILFGSL